MAAIYRITNTETNQMYFGSALEPNRRRKSHFSKLRRGVHDNNFLQNSFNKYGENAFVFEILEEVTNDKEVILAAEQRWIDQHYDNGKQCYNLNPLASSSLGRKYSEETLDKMRIYWAAHSGENHPLFGTKRSEESCRKMSEKAMGRKPSEETRAKMAAAKLGKTRSALSDETKEKIRQSQLGDKNAMRGKNGSKHHLAKAVCQYDLNGNLLASYGSLKEAGDATSINFRSISLCVLGKQKQAGGFLWKSGHQNL